MVQRVVGAGPGKAFAGGGAGCLVGFVVLGGACAAIGGTFYLDLGGAAFLFIVGGFFGLAARWFYKRGREAASSPFDPPPPPEPPTQPGPPF